MVFVKGHKFGGHQKPVLVWDDYKQEAIKYNDTKSFSIDVGVSYTTLNKLCKKNEGLSLAKFIKKNRVTVSKNNTDGLVYIIHCTGTKYYKIGITTDMGRRFSSIQSGCPLELKIVETFYGEKYIDVEKKIHDMYDHKNVRGEWFQLTNKEVSKIKKYINNHIKQ